MKIAKAITSILFSIFLTTTLNIKFGNIPPIGKFLDPFHGFWANAESIRQDTLKELKIEGLTGNTDILFDEKRIPHIFSDNEYDTFFSQGFITAKDRLWQMEFQTRYASGRLSEVVGIKALDLDKYQRRMGMLYGAENMIGQVNKFPELQKIMQAYADGVNAYINTLSPADYPVEFKILDYKPEKWEIINTALLLKLMSATLAGGSDEFYLTNILKKFGAADTKNLFPDYPFLEDPIIPTGTEWDFKPLKIPEAPSAIGTFRSTYIKTKQKVDGIGSNNWAVSGDKSASGYPLLANDPHLDLTLPAIWYQIQLSSPGLNVYGVSIPGAPCVIIGYNQQVAWGVTNVGADILDWYQVRFKDDTKNEYWYNNKWVKTKKRIEKFNINGTESVNDTVYYTHHGPVVYLNNSKPAKFSKAKNIPEGHALRWIAHDASLDVYTFYLMNKAKNYSDYSKALTYFTAPAQNFAFASTDDDIAITASGYFPLKWKEQGKFLLDGSDPQNDWHDRIPADQNPTVKNPKRGFVSSANQSSTDQTYPYYLNWEFGATERGRRINQRLDVMTNINVDSMRNLQNDNYSLLAEKVLPVLVGAVNPDGFSATEFESITILRNWNKFYNAKEIGATLFELWTNNLNEAIWNDEFGDKKIPMRYPSRDRTTQLLIHEPNSKWFDNINTPARETRNELIQTSFIKTIADLQKKYGPVGEAWEWGNVKHSNVPHLAGIAGFGSDILYSGGSKSTINALSESNGPSWRMVVALGKEPKGYGIFPGGESGNPGSIYYDNMINTWNEGKLDELLFLKSRNDSDKRILSRLKLIKK